MPAASRSLPRGRRSLRALQTPRSASRDALTPPHDGRKFHFIMSNSAEKTVAAASLRERIESTLDTIRPALQIDGGDVEFVDFQDEQGVLQVRLVGACGSCPISSMTVKHGIERRIRAMVPEVTEVQAV